jgi:signal transduction histidine kinase
VSFKFECDSALRGSLTLVAPRDWLEQMFGSLLDNAARAAQAGATVRPATVQVEAYLVGDPRAPTVQVAVSDSGAGMPAEERRRIWETAGTGLQLVLQTVHRLHGEARVEDSALGGLKLLLDIPRNPG